MRRLISRATPEKWSRIGGRPRGKHTVSGWCTVSGCCRSWPRIFLFKYVLSTWLVCVATDAAAIAAGRRFFVFFVLPVSSFSARITQMLRAPFYKKQNTERPTSGPISMPLSRSLARSLSPNFIEPLARTPARHNFNWCRHEKQLLHKLTRHQLSCSPAARYPSTASTASTASASCSSIPNVGLLFFAS